MIVLARSGGTPARSNDSGDATSWTRRSSLADGNIVAGTELQKRSLRERHKTTPTKFHRGVPTIGRSNVGSFSDVGLVAPEPFEAVGSELRIPDGVLNVSMAEVVLDRTGVVPLVGELEAAGMTQHVRVHMEPEIRLVAGASYDFPHRGAGHCAAALGREDVGGDRILAT